MANKVQELETENKTLRDKGILYQLSALGDTLHLELKNIKTEQELKHNETKNVLAQILEQAKKTNGRVSKTEDEIDLLKIKYTELLTTVINTNSLLKEQKDSDLTLKNDLQFFIFLSKFPKAAWVFLATIYLLATSGMLEKFILLFK